MDDRRRLATAAALFGAILLLMAADVVFDALEGAGIGHLGAEGAVLALSLAGIAMLVRRLRALGAEARELAGALAASRRDAEQSRRDAERWRTEAKTALAGLGALIDQQFDRWQLSPAEREVGLLLLKGLSHKEIAEVRGTSERTVRQQARAVYAKGGLSGRAELAAWFLEDLLLPSHDEASA